MYGVAPLTLVEALMLLEANGGQVVAADNGCLSFLVSEALPALRRHRVVRAAAVLDSARPTVWRCLRERKPLPDERPAAGGGLA